MSNIATRLLQRVEAATVNITFTTLARLCEGFGADPCRLLGRIPGDPPRPMRRRTGR